MFIKCFIAKNYARVIWYGIVMEASFDVEVIKNEIRYSRNVNFNSY